MAATKPSESTKVGENVSYSIDGPTLTIVVDLDHRASEKPLAKADGSPGKTIRVASTLGNLELPNGVRLGVNAYIYPPR